MAGRISDSALKAGLALAAAVQSGAVAAKPGAAEASRDCPETITEAQAMLARQGRVAGGSDRYPLYYRPDGLSVLGGAPSSLWVTNEPGVLWGFSYGLPASYERSFRRAFEAAYPTGNGFTYHCPANSQCLWTRDGYGANGVQPHHEVGKLLQVGLTANYSAEGYTMSCLYVNRRPPGR
jgi:hypothetical protein